MEETDYIKYRGKCLGMCREAMKDNPSLRLVRGYYYCPIWNKKEAHWWTEKLNGEIYDPTKNQFPSKGHGVYEEFNGTFDCAECGKKVPEAEACIDGNYTYCSVRCHGLHIGAI